jgi:hypothetical protein
VAEPGPRETIKCSAPLGLTDPLQRLNTICHSTSLYPLE